MTTAPASPCGAHEEVVIPAKEIVTPAEEIAYLEAEYARLEQRLQRVIATAVGAVQAFGSAEQARLVGTLLEREAHGVR